MQTLFLHKTVLIMQRARRLLLLSAAQFIFIHMVLFSAALILLINNDSRFLRLVRCRSAPLLDDEVGNPQVATLGTIWQQNNVLSDHELISSHCSNFSSALSPIEFLRSSSKTAWFATRSRKFFGFRQNTNSSNKQRDLCKLRFFMTWFSPLETFRRQEVLAMESLFKSHPDACLLILSSTMDSTQGACLLRPFIEKGFRVTAISPDIHHLSKNTPASPWVEKLRRGAIHTGEVSLAQNLSNLLRLLVLYKFGGVYIDTDVVIMNNFSRLRNAIGAQSIDRGGNWTRLNTAVMSFDKKHPLVSKFIEEFAETFDGNKWGYNGPYLVSRVVTRALILSASSDELRQRNVSRQELGNLTVLPPVAFYPVGWRRIEKLFRRPSDEREARWVSEKFGKIKEESLALHLWNSRSRKFSVEPGSVMAKMVQDRCLIFCNSF